MQNVKGLKCLVKGLVEVFFLEGLFTLIRNEVINFSKCHLPGTVVWKRSVKNVYLEISQNSQENTCAEVSL